jgi:magnesium-transporting ATPase (P-type)
MPGKWRDPTEGALYPFASKLGLDRQAEQAAYPRIDAIPFESEHKFMATLHRSTDGKEVLLVKGAPEVIIERCDRQQTAAGQPAPLEREHFMKASDALAAQGERVLALAWLENPRLKAGGLGPADLPSTSSCSASSASWTRRAKRLSRPSRNAMAAAFASR